MEATNYRRGLEGELARTVSSLNNVKAARVHLAIPKSSVFVRDDRKPSASVLVELYPGRSLEPSQGDGDRQPGRHQCAGAGQVAGHRGRPEGQPASD